MRQKKGARCGERSVVSSLQNNGRKKKRRGKKNTAKRKLDEKLRKSLKVSNRTMYVCFFLLLNRNFTHDSPIHSLARLLTRSSLSLPSLQSVFKARGKGAHAAFFDSDKTCREAVELELERALAKKSVESLINHPNQEHVKEVKIALLGTDLYSGATARAILDVYRHYCLSGHHMFSMQKFGFDQFTQESGIADPISPTCSPHHLETTFITSNLDTKPKWRSAAHSYNRRPDRSLNRAEFIEALIRIGIQKYYADDENPDQAASTGEAVSLLMTHHITNFVHGHGHSNRAILNPDDFRKKALYSHSVDAVLRQGDTLAFLEETYQMNCEAEEGGRISVQAWLRFVRKNASLGGSNPSVKIGFSEEFAKECFIQSRLIVVDEEAPSAALRVRTLSFEDFLEAVVRLTGGVNIEGQVGVALDDPDAVAQRLEALIAVVMAQ